MILNIYEVASFSADHIIIVDKPQNMISEKLLNRTGIAKNKEKLSVIKYSEMRNLILLILQINWIKLLKKYQADFSYRKI